MRSSLSDVIDRATGKIDSYYVRCTLPGCPIPNCGYRALLPFPNSAALVHDAVKEAQEAVKAATYVAPGAPAESVVEDAVPAEPRVMFFQVSPENRNYYRVYSPPDTSTAMHDVLVDAAKTAPATESRGLPGHASKTAKSADPPRDPGYGPYHDKETGIPIRVEIVEAVTGIPIGRFPASATRLSTPAIMEALVPFCSPDLVPYSIYYASEGELNVHPQYASLNELVDTYVRSASRYSSPPEILQVRMRKLYLAPPVIPSDSSDDSDSSDEEDSYIDVPDVGGLSMDQ
jgi:hypothetical protein